MQATLSHYRIQEKIGEGGMGVVYRARDERLARDVALKVLPARALDSPTARKRFHNEALALSKIDHPNIAVVHDFDSQEGTDFLVEELIPGMSLAEILLAGPLPEREVVHLGTQLCEGMAAAHEHGIIHCDLKPANLRVTPDARLKILDFGLAKVLRGAGAGGTEATATASETQSLAGTFPYMSPEQLMSERVDERSDIWGVGCVLYEMAAGQRPFLGWGPAMVEAILHGEPAPLSKLNPKLNPALDAIVAKALDKDPRQRYQSAREIAVDLRRLSSPTTSWGLRVQRQARKRGRIAVAILTAALLAVLGWRMAQWLDRSQPGSQIQGTQPAAHASYLAGVKMLERWDKAGYPDVAIGLFQQAVKSDPDFALGYAALAEAYWAKYRLDKAPRWIEAAEANCRRAAELNNQLPAVYVTLARVHNGRGEYNLALEEIQRALKLEPNDADALLGQAAVYASMGRAEEAESAYKKATALRPQHWGGHYELGVFYYRQRRLADATQQFQQVLEITPDNAMVHAVLGGMLQLLKNNEEAEAHLKRSIELQPSYAAYTNLSALYYREKRWEESVATTRKALEINAEDWRTWANLVLAYEWLGRPEDAAEARRRELPRLEKVAAVNPDEAELQANLAALYAHLKLRDKAVPRIESALARAPENPEVLAIAGETYEFLGEREHAIELAGKALSKGWTLGQMENDPGYRKLRQDPRFPTIARKHATQPSTAHSRLPGAGGQEGGQRRGRTYTYHRTHTCIEETEPQSAGRSAIRQGQRPDYQTVCERRFRRYPGRPQPEYEEATRLRHVRDQ